MKRTALLITGVSLSAFLMCSNVADNSHSKRINQFVSIEKKDTYYNIVLDYRSNPNPFNVGKEYFRQLKKNIPDIEKILDSYIAEMSYHNKRIYKIGIARAVRLRKNIPLQYQREIYGMGSVLKYGRKDIFNDGRLSVNELFALNLLPDIGRGTACSGISVWGSISKKNRVMTGRNLDWNPGSRGQLYKINAVTTILYGNQNKKRSVCLIGYCGMVSVITGFNHKGLFAGILDASTGQRYRLFRRNRSYVMDLRQALEKTERVSEISRYMTDSGKRYSFNHLILVSDIKESKIIENYVYSNKRMVRDSQSKLHYGVQWKEKNAICTVNSFLLKKNFNNHTDRPFNYKRFRTYKKLLKLYKNSVTEGLISIEDLKKMITFRKKGSFLFDSQVRDIFLNGNSSKTLQSIVFVPETRQLYVYFRQKNYNLTGPSFEALIVFE